MRFDSELDREVRAGTPLEETVAWRELADHAARLRTVRIADLLASEPDRRERLTISLDGLTADLSKHRIDAAGLQKLLGLAEASGVLAARDAMLRGDALNFTESRAVLHVALRNRSTEPILVDGEDVMPDVRRVLDQMSRFTERVRSGEWRGATGEPIRHVVNIGIGGSDLGPAMISEALAPFHDGPEVRYLSNVDGADFVETTRGLDPARTLFIVASKSFSTTETMANAHTARRWLLEAVGDASAVRRHFVALSTHRERVQEFGIDPDNMFEFWDWVGGRFSSWSAIGLSVALGIGFERFEQLLGGAHAMDRHFRDAPLDRNLPVLMAMLGVWYTDFMAAATHAVLPYDQRLRRLPAFLQQAEMESNGKSVDRDGNRVGYSTSPVVWGEPGTNGQHAFFQLLHQGTRLVPCDFIAAVHPAHGLQGHHRTLLANMVAQAEALARGRAEDEVRAQLEADGMTPDEAARLAPHRTFEGNRPSTVILLDRLEPRTLGMLIAAYEHKIFVQGIVWRVNSFDQWGVELGKVLAKTAVEELARLERGENVSLDGHDPSTRALIERIARG